MAVNIVIVAPHATRLYESSVRKVYCTFKVCISCVIQCSQATSVTNFLETVHVSALAKFDYLLRHYFQLMPDLAPTISSDYVLCLDFSSSFEHRTH